MNKKQLNQTSRRSFIKTISLGAAVVLTGKIIPLSAKAIFLQRKNVALRFVVASDAHYGQPKTLYDEMLGSFISNVNSFHQTASINFCVINGDIIHNEKPLLSVAKEKIEKLAMPFYVTRGNHDMVSEEHWIDVWNTPLNHHTTINNYALVLGDTSNEKGEYLSPDLKWLAEKLEQYKTKKAILLFLHIPQTKWTVNAIDNPAFFELIKKYKNIKAVFHGHEHDQDGVKMNDNIPYFFDSHIGGNWGTTYKGFRVVELMNDGSMITYMMNPIQKINEITF